MEEKDIAYVPVARSQEVPEGGTRLVRAGRRPILLVRAEGRLYALHGLCSHQGLPLEGGSVWRGLLECPWHHFQFDLASGENVYPKRVYPLRVRPDLRRQVRTLRTYPVRERKGRIEVGIPRPRRER